MKIAVISDIHGNLYALMRVLEDIEDKKVDTIICLGDLVGYGPHPNEVIAMIKRRNIICLKGNYDASVVDESFTYIRETRTNSFSLPFTVGELRMANKFYLNSLPTSLTLEFEGKKVLFVHGSPNKINEYMLEEGDNTASIMGNLDSDVLVCAHTHIPSVKKFGQKLFVNDGSVGKPKIGRPNPTYCVLDIEKDRDVKAQIFEIEYEVKRIIKDMTMLKFPESLIRSFETGVE
ncbi:metallophosphoesterase family protein [Clostridium baratii]|uniref:metallophosphoesterase family protein n=1 Tax=Clostridium baratii TaxID=1561 RepID=UPI001C00F1DA|nr:metallophosphoesterase family protein [Clostridium baratii]MBT9830850.1 YfcE family phosphodiesterase [Clostridium baratii]